MNPIIEQITQLADTYTTRVKLMLIDKCSDFLPVLVTDLLAGILLLFAFFSINIALAMFIGSFLHSLWMGFGCVTLFYALISIAASFLKAKLHQLLTSLMIYRVLNKNK